MNTVVLFIGIVPVYREWLQQALCWEQWVVGEKWQLAIAVEGGWVTIVFNASQLLGLNTYDQHLRLGTCPGTDLTEVILVTQRGVLRFLRRLAPRHLT
jgi:hypothetical protein